MQSTTAEFRYNTTTGKIMVLFPEAGAAVIFDSAQRLREFLGVGYRILEDVSPQIPDAIMRAFESNQ